MQIVWTKKGSNSFNGIQNYIEQEFSEKEVLYFVNQTYTVISHIVNFPNMYPIYKVDKNVLTILLFWNNRKDPSSKKY